MTKEQIHNLLVQGEFPEVSSKRKLVETHISWVFLCDEFVYKIKKPVHYPFLNFSTLKLRRHFCEREIVLNRRLSGNIYIEVLPVSFFKGRYYVGQERGEVIEYAVKMHKLNPEKQMDILLANNKVRPVDIKNLAECISKFHKGAEVIFDKKVMNLKREFNELKNQKEFLSKYLDKEVVDHIDNAIKHSDIFMKKNIKLMMERLNSGLYRDCHGDLHTRNIFLLPEPQPFDCIEFNDEFRKIDVLNEVAFLCMDLDSQNRKDFSQLFIKYYNLLFPVIRNDNDRQLFNYYKSYRANVRAKVNSLRASGSIDEASKIKALTEADKYLKIMNSYITNFQ